MFWVLSYLCLINAHGPNNNNIVVMSVGLQQLFTLGHMPQSEAHKAWLSIHIENQRTVVWSLEGSGPLLGGLLLCPVLPAHRALPGETMERSRS